jgi:hypothetical protein
MGGGANSINLLLKKLDSWHYWYYNIDMKKRVSKRIPNMSIRVKREAIKLAKIEAIKADMTLGEWLEAAIKEKIKRDKRD